MTKRMEQLHGDMEFAMNGQIVNIAQHKEFWCTLKNGVAVPIAKVGDGTPYDPYCPFYYMPIFGYDDTRYELADITEESADELYTLIVDILY